VKNDTCTHYGIYILRTPESPGLLNYPKLRPKDTKTTLHTFLAAS
jgi:hypothetical protein